LRKKNFARETHTATNFKLKPPFKSSVAHQRKADPPFYPPFVMEEESATTTQKETKYDLYVGYRYFSFFCGAHPVFFGARTKSQLTPTPTSPPRAQDELVRG